MEPQNFYPVMQVFGVEIPTRCFIGGLPYSMTELELNNFFSQFGAVRDTKIITDRNGVSKGYGFVTYQTEQEAADVCARGSLYYKEKKLNISKAIRRQGGQFSKANQEFMNGQRLLYQSSEGYLLGHKNGAWMVEEPSHFCQPSKPYFQPVFVGAPTATTTAGYLQSPVTPTYYPAMSGPAMAPYDHIPPALPPDPALLLYCDLVESVPLLPTPLSLPPHPQSHPHPPPPPPPQLITTGRQESVESSCQVPDSTTSPLKESPTAELEDQAEEEKTEGNKSTTAATEEQMQNITTSRDPGTLTATTASTDSLSVDLDDKCLVKPVKHCTDGPEGEIEREQKQKKESGSRVRPAKPRPPNLTCLSAQATPTEPVVPRPQQNYLTYQCTS